MKLVDYFQSRFKQRYHESNYGKEVGHFSYQHKESFSSEKDSFIQAFIPSLVVFLKLLLKNRAAHSDHRRWEYKWIAAVINILSVDSWCFKCVFLVPDKRYL